EARAALRLRHEHIVAVRDIGRIDQQFYIAMDFIEGRTLAEHIHSAQSRGLPSPLYEDPAFYLGSIRDVCNALHYAHTFPPPIFTGEPLSILLQAMRNLPEKPTDVIRKTTSKAANESTKMLLKISKLEGVCLKCLAREPKERFPSARDVAEELSMVLAAMEAGKETGMVPQRVLEAQERSEIHRIDGHITRFDLDSAMQET